MAQYLTLKTPKERKEHMGHVKEALAAPDCVAAMMALGFDINGLPVLELEVYQGHCHTCIYSFTRTVILGVKRGRSCGLTLKVFESTPCKL